MLRINRRQCLYATAALAFSPSGASAQRELRALNAFAPNFVFSREISQVFYENVRKASAGAINFRVGGPDVVPFAEQFQPTAAGAFDMLFTHPAYHSGTTAIGLAMDAVAADPVKRRESGVIDWVDRHYQKLGLKVLAVVPTGSKGFHYISKTPLKASSPALAGMKVRGTVSYHPMIKALGGAPVVLGGGEVYTALERGVIDAAAWGLTGVLDFKWNEVAKYFTRPSFGQASLYVFFNLKAWQAMDSGMQRLLTQEALKLEMESVQRFDALARAEEEQMRKLGMQETLFPDADASRLDALLEQGIWEIARNKNGTEADNMYALAKRAGLCS